MDPTPAGWSVYRFDDRSFRFSNNAHRIEVRLQPTSQTKSTNSTNANADQYVIEVFQGRSGSGTMGSRNMSTTIDSWEEGRTTVYRFMEEFNAEQATLASDEVESVHRSLDDIETAESVLSTTTAAEALADAAGYSDDLFLTVLATETNRQFRLVAHRNGNEVNTVYHNEDTLTENISIEKIHAAFPVDTLSVQTVLDTNIPIATTIHVGNHTIYRFIFGDRQETDVVLPRGIQLVTPEFERAAMHVLDEKWT